MITRPKIKFRLEIGLAELALAAIVTLALLLPMSARAEYRLGVGDVLETSIVGAPELRNQVTVNVDGEIAVPLLGPLKVAGLSLSDVRTTLERVLATKMLRLRTPDGRENASAISPEEISIHIIGYRPIYLDGDVSKPGEQAYRPNLTVRQAISVAGGLDLARFRISNPVLETVDLRSQYEVLLALIAQKEGRIGRLQAELAGRTQPDVNAQKGNSSSPGSQIAGLEADLLQSRDTHYAREKSYLSGAIKQAESRLSILNTQQKQESEGVQFDEAELGRVKALLDKGQGTVMRMTDARRALLMSSTRQLQTVSVATQIEVQRDELARRLQKVDDERRMQVLDDMQTATSELDIARSRLTAVQEKMLYVGAVRSELVQGTGKPEILLFRMGENGEERIEADPHTVLLPGDVVHVTLKSATDLIGR